MVDISIPEKMFKYLNIDEDQTELRRNAMLLYSYIKNLTISHGKAADILGISKWKLISLYDDLGLPYLDQDISEVIEEVEVYRRLQEDIKYDSNRWFFKWISKRFV